MEQAQEVFEAGTRAEEAGDFDQARLLYEQSSLLDPTHPLPGLRLAFLLGKEGDWKQSILAARQLTKRWPRLHPAYCHIARSYGELGRWKLAERYYRRALAIKQEPGYFILLGSALDRLERHDEAEECIHKALEVDPDYEEAHYNLGYLHKARGEFDAAEKHLRRAIELDPKYALAYAELGALLAGREDRRTEAVRLLRKAVEYDPNDGWSKAYLAFALWMLRKLKAAEEQYRDLMKLWPDRSISYWCYGDFLAKEGKEASTAERYLRKAVALDSEDPEANYYLGKHLYYWDREEEARRLLTKAARLDHSRARDFIRSISA